MQTPRLCGAPLSAGVEVFSTVVLRPFLTSWFTVGMLSLARCPMAPLAPGNPAIAHTNEQQTLFSPVQGLRRSLRLGYNTQFFTDLSALHWGARREYSKWLYVSQENELPGKINSGPNGCLV